MTERYIDDQVTETRRLLEQMCPTASNAIRDTTNAVIDDVASRSTPMTPTKPPMGR
jgi:hypothetical protein